MRAHSLRFARWARGMWQDHDPLRRRTGRVEAAIVACLLAAFLAGVPLAAVLAGRWAYAAGLASQHAEQAARHRVTAVLLARVPEAQTVRGTDIGSPVRARWTAPDGAVRTGMVYAPAGARVGATVPVWVTPAGRLTASPLQHFQVVGQAELAAIAAVLGAGLVMLAVGIVARAPLIRRRLAAWGVGLTATGPLRSSQH